MNIRQILLTLLVLGFQIQVARGDKSLEKLDEVVHGNEVQLEVAQKNIKQLEADEHDAVEGQKKLDELSKELNWVEKFWVMNTNLAVLVGRRDEMDAWQASSARVKNKPKPGEIQRLKGVAAECDAKITEAITEHLRRVDKSFRSLEERLRQADYRCIDAENCVVGMRIARRGPPPSRTAPDIDSYEMARYLKDGLEAGIYDVDGYARNRWYDDHPQPSYSPPDEIYSEYLWQRHQDMLANKEMRPIQPPQLKGGSEKDFAKVYAFMDSELKILREQRAELQKQLDLRLGTVRSQCRIRSAK